MSQSTFVFHLGAWNILLWPTFKDREVARKIQFLRVCRNTGISENTEPLFPHGNHGRWLEAAS